MVVFRELNRSLDVVRHLSSRDKRKFEAHGRLKYREHNEVKMENLSCAYDGTGPKFNTISFLMRKSLSFFTLKCEIFFGFLFLFFSFTL